MCKQDQMILIIDNDTKHKVALKNIVEEFFGGSTMIHHSKVTKKEITRATTIILSGGSHRGVANHENIYRHYMPEIIKHPGVVIGICLGAQLLCTAYGGKVERITPIKGNYTIQYKDEDYLVYRAQKRGMRFFPPTIKTLNMSETIAKHRKKNHRALFFHPEITTQKPMPKNIISHICLSLKKEEKQTNLPIIELNH